MSISGALTSAMSGLNSAARNAEIVSTNIANSLTEGYGRRSLSQSASTIGGVTINGVVRHIDIAVLADRRLADADYNNSRTVTDFLESVESLMGTPSDSYSLSARLADFETSLVEGASLPESNERLESIFRSAQNVASSLNTISDGIQESRTTADSEIAMTVDQLNVSLEQVQELNRSITSAQSKGRDTSSLEDLRQQTIDAISEIIPVREVARDNGAVALFTSGGSILLDGTAATLGFTSSNTITPHMTQENGLLSGLTINGIEINTSSENSPIKGGKLAALFEIRDELSVTAQTQVDAVARDLVERYQDASVDPTLGATDAGLFTDEGGFFTASNEVGLAGRLEINAAVDPDEGGGVWRLRDGIGATTPGAVGDATLLQSMRATLDSSRTPSSGNFGTTALTAAGLTASMLSQAGSSRQAKEEAVVFATAQLDELKTQELSDGVDSDYEIQRLLLIEQAYAANARMIETVDEMMQTLLRL